MIKFRNYCALRRTLYFLWFKDIFVDIYARFFYKPSLEKLESNTSPKIVLFNSGHLGDALIMSYALPAVKEKYPDAIIDVVCGEWCKFIFKDNPLVRKVIIQNHFLTNRKNISEIDKLINHFKTAKSAAQELKQETYDFSIDVRYSAAVSHWLLPFIKVKHSLGFGTRGYGGLLEKEFFLPKREFHTYEMIAMLFNEIGVKTNLLEVEPYLPFQAESIEKVKEKVEISSNTLLIFPESGGEEKMFDTTFWITIFQKLLTKTKFSFLLCGEKIFTENLFQVLQTHFTAQKNRIAFAGKLNLSEVATLPQIASAAITLDSFPAHLCAIFCKTAVLSKKAGGYQFYPITKKETLMLHDHLPSEDIVLARKNFTTHYVEQFSEKEMEEIVVFLNK